LALARPGGHSSRDETLSVHRDSLSVLEVRSFTIDVRLDEGQVVVAHTYFDEADVIEQVLRN